MSSSLEELLVEDGLRGRRSVSGSRSSLSSKTKSMPLYSSRDQRKMDSSSISRIRTERRSSDVSEYRWRSELPIISDDNTGRRPRDYLVRKDKMVGESKKEKREIFEGESSNFGQNEIVEVGLEENQEAKDEYFNVRNLEKRDGYSRRVGGKEEYRRSGKGIKTEEGRSSSRKDLLERSCFSDKHRKSMNQHETDKYRSVRGLKNRNGFEDEEIRKQDRFVPSVSQPALDEVAVKAMMSILNDYIERFLTNKDFRTTLRHSCFWSLNFTGQEDRDAGSNVINNLEEAVEVVERAAEDSASAKELKKASFQLSMITGLNSDDLKDEFTSGTPNYKLSACAHLYLSVIFKLQKKDMVSAMHLLQVFCDSPSQARMALLPELWEDMFLPHLSHLKDWYNLEAKSLVESPTRPSKLMLLDKVYNEILDSGTYQFAVYYKDWLTGGVEAPSVPSIHIPSVSLGGFQKEGSRDRTSEVASPAAAFSPKPMVRMKLYDDVFRLSHESGVEEAGNDVESDNFDAYDRSSNGSANVKQTLTYTSKAVKQPHQDIEECSSESALDAAFLHEDGFSSTAEEKWRKPLLNLLQEKDVYEKDKSSEALNLWHTTPGDTRVSHIPPHYVINEIILKELAKSAFKLPQAEGCVDLSVSGLPQLTEPVLVKNSFEELHETYAYFAGASHFSRIPEDFICPLTGKLFEDPVTLETGQTFEKTAIKEWLDQGNRNCPVTGKTLEYLSVPHTNFVLKRVIDSWKAEYCRHLLDSA